MISGALLLDKEESPAVFYKKDCCVFVSAGDLDAGVWVGETVLF